MCHLLGEADELQSCN